MQTKRLLIVTQILDKNDPLLGFFHQWVKEFAYYYEHVSVVCLKKGICNLPSNVTVFSLGKESGYSKVRYLIRFFKFIFMNRRSHESVFVHMNQEYVLLGGWFWRLLGKRVFLWRNHKNGTWLTRCAVFFTHRVFFTSPDSFTAHFRKSIQMPVGIDMALFQSLVEERNEKSVLYIGRISPVKNIECLIESISILVQKGIQCKVTVCGPVSDYAYYTKLQNLVSSRSVATNISFSGALLPENLPLVYNTNTVCVNMTASGSFDKTIFESILCGAFPVVANKSIMGVVPEQYKEYILFEIDDPRSMAVTLEKALTLNEEKKNECLLSMQHNIKVEHSLSVLVTRLSQYL